MTCPHCGQKIRPGVRFCPHCNYWLEGGRMVSTVAPRAPWWRRHGSPTAKMSRWRRRRMRPPSTTVLIPVAWQWSIIPGLAQMLSHRPWRGFVYFAGVAGLLTFAMGLQPQQRMMLTGLAAGLHGLSILNAMPCEIRNDVTRRVKAMFFIMLGCMAFYYPLTLWMNTFEPIRWATTYAHYGEDAGRVANRARNEQEGWEAFTHVMLIYVAPIFLIGSVIVSSLISEVISLPWRRPKKGNGRTPKPDEGDD